jgi:3-hydroxyisobutyrate dehydrogenase
MTTIGWIGVGAMGLPMAQRLVEAGHTLSAYDVNPARLGELTGATLVASPAETAVGAEVLALMVATPAQAEACLYGPDGAAAHLQPGALVLLMATVGPQAAIALSERLAADGVTLVDAPVSGGVRRAGIGDLLVMVGGPPADVSRAEPLLQSLASTVATVGPFVGDGQKVKLVNQLLTGVHIAVAAEALAFAEALGLDPRATYEVVRHGAAHSFMLEDRGDRMTRAAFDDVRSALDIFVKDMGLVTGAAHDVAYPTPLASVAEQLYLAGRRAGLGRLDDSVVIEVLRGHATTD